MVLCDRHCKPCCDYCTHAIHEEIKSRGKVIKGGPIGCKKHPDEKHKGIAESCGFCDDFHCVNAADEK